MSSDDTVPVDGDGRSIHRELDAGRLNHYVLLRRLGQGGMGIVYAAFDQKLERKVAVKLLRSPDNPEAQRRLVREAQAMARLSHPNVVQIYEISEIDDTVFIVMEFVNGMTLRQWLATKRRTQAEILEVFVAAGRGLEAAHGRGLVHRDFKPDNVMIRTDGRVLVMDFGLAHGSASEFSRVNSTHGVKAGLELDLTTTGQLLGTPAYMAPEQFNGTVTDARTDQFSYCVALWEALHGERPFTASGFQELAYAVTTGRHRKVEASDVPAWLRRIIWRGLEVNPGRRWPSFGPMLAALSADPTRRRRAVAIAVASVVAVLGIVLALWVVRVRERADTTAACQEEGRSLERVWNQAAQARLAQAFQSTGLGFAPESWQHAQLWLGTYVQEWTEVRTRVCMATKVDRQHDEQYYALATACLDERETIFNGLLEAWVEPDSAIVARAADAASELPPISTCTSESSLARRIGAPEELDVAVTGLRRRLQRAAALEHAGRYEDGLIAAKAVLGEAGELGWDPLEAEAWLAVGELEQDLGQYEHASASVKRAYLGALASGHDLIAFEASASLTWMVGTKFGHEPEGLLWGEIAAALVQRLGLEGSMQEAALFNYVGTVLRNQGELERALETHQRALAIRERLVGPLHPYVATSLNNIGVVLWSLGRYDDALAAHQRALVISRAAFGSQHMLVASAQANIGNVMLEQGQYDAALEAHRETLRIKQAVFGSDHPNCAKSYNNIGVILNRRGSYREASESFERAVEIWEARLGPRDAKVANALTGLGVARHGLGEIEAARADLERALAIWTENHATSSDLAEAHLALARVLWDAGDFERARELGRAALDGYTQMGPGAEAELAEAEAWLREHDAE
jgi:tetratricopeptide (TPR) repeat protein/predicted Ser/Thr protein kinase